MSRHHHVPAHHYSPADRAGLDHLFLSTEHVSTPWFGVPTYVGPLAIALALFALLGFLLNLIPALRGRGFGIATAVGFVLALLIANTAFEILPNVAAVTRVALVGLGLSSS